MTIFREERMLLSPAGYFHIVSSPVKPPATQVWSISITYLYIMESSLAESRKNWTVCPENQLKANTRECELQFYKSRCICRLICGKRLLAFLHKWRSPYTIPILNYIQFPFFIRKDFCLRLVIRKYQVSNYQCQSGRRILMRGIIESIVWPRRNPLEQEF